MAATKPVRRYPHRATVRAGGVTVTVRYAVEWDLADLERMVGRAVGNRGGKSDSGPIRVYVHPEDRLP